MHKCEFSKLDGLVNNVGWQNNSLILAPNLSVVCVNNKILESDWFSATLVYKGNGLTGVQSPAVCNRTSDKQNRTTA